MQRKTPRGLSAFVTQDDALAAISLGSGEVAVLAIPFSGTLPEREELGAVDRRFLESIWKV